MCPSLPLGRREMDMEAGVDVGGTAPQGTLMGHAPGDSRSGPFSQAWWSGVWMDVKGSDSGCKGMPMSTQSEVGRWLKAK